MSKKLKCPKCHSKYKKIVVQIVDDRTMAVCQNCGDTFDVTDRNQPESQLRRDKHTVQKDKNITNRERIVAFSKTSFGIILSFVLFPPLGAILWFRYKAKPNKKTKALVSSVVFIFWIVLIASAQSGYKASFDIDGNKVEISCSKLCSRFDSYGDKDTLRHLAILGVTSVDSMPSDRNGDSVDLTVDKGAKGGIGLRLNYKDNKLISIVNIEHPTIIYYSTDQTIKTQDYPSSDEIIRLRSEIDKKKAQEEQSRKEAEARVPSDTDTSELCKKQFNQDYPYKGSKVHSIMGVIANNKRFDDSRFYKVEVTIENAYGASRKSVMECTVQKSGDSLQITSFFVY